MGSLRPGHPRHPLSLKVLTLPKTPGPKPLELRAEPMLKPEGPQTPKEFGQRPGGKGFCSMEHARSARGIQKPGSKAPMLSCSQSMD